MQKTIKWNRGPKEIAEVSVKVRGDIERMMIAIKNLSGMVQEVTLSEFNSRNNIECSSPEMIDFGEF